MVFGLKRTRAEPLTFERVRTLDKVVVMPNFENTFELQERDIDEFQRFVQKSLGGNGLITKYERDVSHTQQRGLYVQTQRGLVFDGFESIGLEEPKDLYLRFKGSTSDLFRIERNHTLFSFLRDGVNIKGLWISTPLLRRKYDFHELNPWTERASVAYIKE